MKVERKSLEVHLDDRGYLFEALRADDDLFDGEFAQATVARLFSGVVKAWHCHEHQTDYMVCVHGNVKVGLAEEATDGDETPDVETLCIGEDDPTLVKIPPGVWHGMTPIGDRAATVLYVQDQTYDPDDEYRKPADAFGDVWSVTDR